MNLTMKYLGASGFCRSGSGGNNVTFHLIPMEEEGSPSPSHDCTPPLLTALLPPHRPLLSTGVKGFLGTSDQMATVQEGACEPKAECDAN